MEEINPFISKTKREIRVHKVERKDTLLTPSIEYSNNYEIPKLLTKYYRADNYGYNVLKEEKIWAAHPNGFNDPFDCSVKMWKLDDFPKEFVKAHLNDLKVELKKKGLILEETDSSGSIESIRRQFFEFYLRMMGIFCLNSDDNSDLLWGYYNNQEGFSIVFNSDILNSIWKIRPLKVEYESIRHFKKLTLIQKEIENFDVVPKIIRWTTLKKKNWFHENEWRYIFFDIVFEYQDSRLKSFPKEAINEVVLGYKYFREQIDNHRDNFLTDDTRSFDFLPEDNQYKWYILSNIFEKQFELYQIELSEEFEFRKRKIEILEMSKNRVVIYYSEIFK
jgi:hypothetical protein